MAVAYVRDTGVVSGAAVSTLAASFAALPAAGNFIVVSISNYDDTDSEVVSVADNQGNGAYTKARERQNVVATGEYVASQWYKENIGTPSGTFTVTATLNAGSYPVMVAAEFSGVATATVLRDSGDNIGFETATDANVATAGTDAVAGDLVVANCVVAISGSSNVGLGANATTGYTNFGLAQDWANVGSLSADHKNAGAGGSQTANWSHNSCIATNDGWAAVVAVYKAAAAGGVVIPVLMAQYRMRR